MKNRRCNYCKTKQPIETLLIKWIKCFCNDNCYQDYITHLKPNKTPVTQRKAINKISKKRKERLSWYSEKDLFREILIEREDNWLLTCEICNKQFSIEPSTTSLFCSHIK